MDNHQYKCQLYFLISKAVHAVLELRSDHEFTWKFTWEFFLPISLYQPTPLTALHVAASQGHNDKVECLVKQGDDVNIKDDNYGVSVTILLADSR